MLMFRPLIRYADFKGRARRAEYWLFVIFQGAAVGLCLLAAVSAFSDKDIAAAAGRFALGLCVAALVALGLVIPFFAVLARRLHDTDKSAWWMLLLAPGYLSPMLIGGAIVGAAGQAMAGGDQAAAEAAVISAVGGSGAVMLVASLCNMILLTLTMMRGTRGPNRFGPDPRNSHAAGEAGGIYDEDRLEALFAEARRDNVNAGETYTPVFDFGPGPKTAPTAAAATPVAWDRAAFDSGVAPARPFGRRTGL